MKKTKILLVICLMVVVSVASIAGTIAWLTDKADPVVNTFTPSTIGVELEETVPAQNTAKMVPGATIAKDPKTWIVQGSEDAYLFIKIEKSANFDTYLTATIADGWTKVTNETGIEGVYYRTVTGEAKGKDAAFPILENNQVTVKTDVTLEQMEALDADSKYPTLSFTAYAIQKDNITVEAAKIEAAKENALNFTYTSSDSQGA